MTNARTLRKLLTGMLAAAMTLSLSIAGGNVSNKLLKPTEVKAASGHWELTNQTSLGPYSDYKSSMGNGWSLQNNGFQTTDDSWSCRVNITSAYDGSVTDLDLRFDAPSKTYNAGQEISIGYEYTIRDASANEVPEVDAGFSSDERVMTLEYSGSIDDVSKFYFGDDEVLGKNNGHTDYIWDRGGVNPNFWSKSTIYSTLEEGKESGEKIYLTLGAEFGRSEVYMRAVYEYTWTIGAAGAFNENDATLIGENGGTWVFVKGTETVYKEEDGYVSSFEGIVDGNVVLKTHKWTPNPWGGADYYEERDQYYVCSVPPVSIGAGEEVSLVLHTYTRNLNLGAKQIGYSAGECMAEINTPDLDDLSSVADYGYFYIVGTDNEKYVGKGWNEDNQQMDLSATVVARMPEADDFKEGDRVSIYFSNFDEGPSFYEWQYEFREAGSSPSYDVTSGIWERSPSADQTYHDSPNMVQNYEGIENGMVKYSFLMTSGSASHKSELYCTDAPKYVSKGEIFNITLTTTIIGVTHDFYGPPNSYIYIDGSSAITDS